MHRNTAYWPERFTPASLCREAKEWRAKATGYLDAAAHAAAHQTLRKNAARAAERAAADPRPINLNSAGSMANQVADGASELSEELAALADRPCPDPPASVIVYREPGEPPSWAAESITHDEPIGGHSRALASLRVHGYPTREGAIAALREIAEHREIVVAAQGRDYHAARVRAAARAALEADPVEVRIRLAGEDRPEDWDAVR